VIGFLAYVAHAGRTAATPAQGRMSWRLHLDAAQREQLRAIVMDAHQQIRYVRWQVQPEVEKILQDAATKIRATIHPDQQARFDQLAVDARA